MNGDPQWRPRVNDGISSELAFKWAEKITQLESALAAERAHADRLAEWIDGSDHRLDCNFDPWSADTSTCDCGRDAVLAEHDRMREAQR